MDQLLLFSGALLLAGFAGGTLVFCCLYWFEQVERYLPPDDGDMIGT